MFQNSVVGESSNQLFLILKTEEGLFYLSCHCNKISDKKNKRSKGLLRLTFERAHRSCTGMGEEDHDSPHSQPRKLGPETGQG